MRGVAERREALDRPRHAAGRATARLPERGAQVRKPHARSPLGAPPRLSAAPVGGLPPQLRAGLPGTRAFSPSPSPASTLRSGRNAARRDARSRPSARPTSRTRRRRTLPHLRASPVRRPSLGKVKELNHKEYGPVKRRLAKGANTKRYCEHAVCPASPADLRELSERLSGVVGWIFDERDLLTARGDATNHSRLA